MTELPVVVWPKHCQLDSQFKRIVKERNKSKMDGCPHTRLHVIACNSRKMVDMLNFVVCSLLIPIDVMYLWMYFVIYLWGGKWDEDTGHFTAWGTLYFPYYSLFCKLSWSSWSMCVMLHQMQPWIRLTLYNPNACKIPKCHQI